MAKKSLVEFKMGKGWKELQLWARAFEGRLDQSLTRGTKKSLQFAKAEIIGKIESGDFERNSELVLLIKRVKGINVTPLIGQKNSIIRGISTEVVSPIVGKVGLLANRKTANGEQLANIGKLLHDGGTIKITKKMREGFAKFIGSLEHQFNFKLVSKSSGKGSITIPARKFIKDVIEAPNFQKKVEDIYFEEIRRGGRF